MQKTKRKIKLVPILRLLAQIAFFILLPSLFVSAYGGVRILVSSLAHHTAITAAQAPQLIAAVAVFPATAFLGRFFCGWMCAFGAFADFIRLLFGRFVKVKVPERLDAALKYVKYVLLVFLVVAGWVFGVKTFASANPWDAFGMLSTVGQPFGIGYVLESLAPAFILLLIIAAGSVFVERFFCRYLCPLGALFAIVSKIRIVRIVKPNGQCGKCRACTRQCAMGIPLYKKSAVTSGECIGCMKCVPICPRKNVSAAIAGYDIRPLAAGLLTVAAVTGTYLIGNIEPAEAAGNTSVLEETKSAPQTTGADALLQNDPGPAPSALPSPSLEPAQPEQSAGTTEPAPRATPQPTPAQQAASLYKDGTYEGSGRGYRGATTTVKVTIQNGAISGVKVVSHGDDRQFFQYAYSVVAQEILDAQSPEVDAVSGATYSSNGIMSAVADALGKALI